MIGHVLLIATETSAPDYKFMQLIVISGQALSKLFFKHLSPS